MTSDHWVYDHLANNIIDGNGYLFNEKSAKYTFENYSRDYVQEFQDDYFYGVVPYGETTAFWEPGYPVFLAVIYKIFGNKPLFPIIVQALLWAGIIYISYLLATKIGNHRTGLISALILTFFPVSIYLSGSLMSETLFIFLLVISIYLIFKSFKSYFWWLLPVSGILFGLSFLTRSFCIFWLPVFLFALYKFQIGHRISAIILWCIGVLIAIAPWVIRNNYAMGEPLIFPTKGMVNFWMWNIPTSNDEYINLEQQLTNAHSLAERDSLRKELFEMKIPELKGQTELARTAELKSIAVDNIKNYPVEFLQRYITRFILFISPAISSQSMKIKVGYFILYLPFVLLSIPGYYYGLKGNKYSLFFFLLIVVFYIIMPAFFWRGRFKIIIEPFIIIFASYYISTLVDKYKAKKTKHNILN